MSYKVIELQSELSSCLPQMSNPQRSLSKRKNSLIRATEKALKVIDGYQTRVNILPFIKQVRQIEDSHKYATTQIFLKQTHKIQCLPNSNEFLKLQLNRQAINIKVVLTHVKARTFHFSVGFDRKYPSPHNSDINYLIRKENIIVIKKSHHQKVNFIYFGIKPTSQVVMFCIRVDQGKAQRVQTQAHLTNQENKGLQMYKSMTLIPINSRFKISNRAFSLQRFTNRKKVKVLSPLEIGKIQDMRKQSEQQKAQSARFRKEKIDLCNRKQRQMREKATQCKDLFVKYEKQRQAQIKKRGLLNQNITSMLFVAKVLGFMTQQFQTHQRKLQIAVKVAYLMKKFQKIMYSRLRQAKSYIQSQKHRNLMKVSLLSAYLSRNAYIHSSKKAAIIITDVIEKLRTGCMVNNAFNAANQYRRKIRIIQRFWIQKFKARTSMIEYFGDTQVQKMMKTMDRLKPIYPLYKQSEICRKFAIQYQKDQAGKIHEYFQMYNIKMDEIRQFERMNQQIRIFNSTALKKRQKQYLDVPVKPSKPQAKFFRNLQIFKSTIRGWLQVQNRKYVRRARKQLQDQKIRKQQQQKRKKQQEEAKQELSPKRRSKKTV